MSYMINFSGACPVWKHFSDFFYTLFRALHRRGILRHPILIAEMKERVDDGTLFESEHLDRNRRREILISKWRRRVFHSTVPSRAHGMADLLWGVPQWPTGMKSVEFLEVFYSLEVSKHRSGCSPRSPASLPVIYK